jgi:hypothetical protein
LRSFLVDDSVHILNLLYRFRISDVDKLIRSQPAILVESEEEILIRLRLFLSISHKTFESFPVSSLGQGSLNISTDSELFLIDKSSKDSVTPIAYQALNGLILAYPGLLGMPSRFVFVTTEML